jgi:hypothetical protein
LINKINKNYLFAGAAFAVDVELALAAGLLSIALFAIFPAVFAIFPAVFAIFPAVFAIFPAVFAIVPAVFVVAVEAVFDAVVFAGLFVFVVLVGVSQAIPIAPRAKTVDNTKVFFILIKFSCLLQRLLIIYLTAKRGFAPNDLFSEHSTI